MGQPTHTVRVISGSTNTYLDIIPCRSLWQLLLMGHVLLSCIETDGRLVCPISSPLPLFITIHNSVLAWDECECECVTFNICVFMGLLPNGPAACRIWIKSPWQSNNLFLFITLISILGITSFHSLVVRLIPTGPSWERGEFRIDDNSPGGKESPQEE